MATQLEEPITTPDAVIANGADNITDARDFEAEARLKGWKPEEEFEEGEKRPAKFKDAETFLKAEEDVSGFQKKTIARMAEEINFLKRQAKRLMQSEQNAYANALEKVREDMSEAWDAGDKAKFDKLEAKAEKIRTDMAADGGFMRGEDPNEVFHSFRRENLWLDRGALASASREEADARVLFNQVCDRYVAQGLDKQMAPSEFFAKAKLEVEAEYPDILTGAKAPRPKPPSDVANVTNRGTALRNNVSLSADEKAQAERYMALKIPGFRDCKSKDEAHKLFAKLGAN